MKTAKALEIRGLAREFGLEIDSMGDTGGSHIRVVFRRKDGATMLAYFASTPSDRRGRMNKRAEVMRFASGFSPYYGQPGSQQPQRLPAKNL